MRPFHWFRLIGLLALITLGHGTELPYPIVFVHGINSSYNCWFEGTDMQQSMVDLELTAQVVDITLDRVRNAEDPSDNKMDDVHLFTAADPAIEGHTFEDVQDRDFYFINFDIDFQGGRRAIDNDNVLDVEEFYISPSQTTIDINCFGDYFTGGFNSARVGDIIRIDDEYMLITGTDNNVFGCYILVQRGIYGTTPVYHYPSMNQDLLIISAESNQNAISKAAYGLHLAIQSILTTTNSNQVILVGHSMGGLVARCCVRDYDSLHVKRVVTIGTPNLGAIKEDLYLDSVIPWINALDQKSEAVRDLGYGYDPEAIVVPSVPGTISTTDTALFLFGQNQAETEVPNGLFINRDLNANGDEDDYITGINRSPVPNQVQFVFLVGNGFSSTTRTSVDNDGVVQCPRQWLNFASGQFAVPDYSEKLEFNAVHVEQLRSISPSSWFETESFQNTIRTLDEPYLMPSGFDLVVGEVTNAMISDQSASEHHDRDCFKFSVDHCGDYAITVSCPITLLDSVDVFDAATDALLIRDRTSPFQMSLALTPGEKWLRIWGTGSQDSWRHPYSILVEAQDLPQIAISAAVLSGLAPFTLHAQAMGDIQGLALDWIVNGGPQVVATGPLLDYTFPQSGSHLVTLRAWDGDCQVADATISIEVYAPAQAAYSASPVVGNAPLAVQFTDESSGHVISWQWDFNGDGQVDSNLQHPQHTYSANGLYSVTLTVSDGVNSSSHTESGYIHVGSESFLAMINAAEYYFDADPGQGQGHRVTISPTQAPQLAREISLSGLAPGFHTLYWRFRSTAGVWGMPQGRAFYISPESSPNGTSPLIASAEYYLDADPGQGMGSPFDFADAAQVAVASSLPGLAAEPGFHTLFWRFRSDHGVWGMPQGRAFYVSPESSPSGIPPLISAAEYYLDQDPGQGAGNPVELTDSSHVQVAMTLPDVSTEPGFHTLYWRFRSDHGVWGMPQSRAFYVSPEDVDHATLQAAEFFLDTDPGQGNGVPMQAVDGVFDEREEEVAATWTVQTTAGAHQLGIRFQSSRDVWGQPLFAAFTVQAEPGAIVDLAIRFENGALVLSWSPVPGISEYRLYSNDQGGYQINSLLATTSNTSLTLSVLPTDGRSVYQVRSYVPTGAPTTVLPASTKEKRTRQGQDK